MTEMDYLSIVREERKKSRALLIRRSDSNVSNQNFLKEQPEQQINETVPLSQSINIEKNSFAFRDFSLESYRVGLVPNLFYIPNAISVTDEFQLLESVAFAGTLSGDAWKQLKNRRLQSWGRSLTGDISDDKPLPSWLQKISEALVSYLIFDLCDTPNHVLINEYKTDEGILHHTDGPVYRDKVAILSLSSPCLMTFRRKLESQDVGGGNSGDVFSVLLQPRSLLVFSDTIYSLFMHGIADGKDTEVVGGTAPCVNMELAGVTEGQEVSAGSLPTNMPQYALFASMPATNISSVVIECSCAILYTLDLLSPPIYCRYVGSRAPL